jgi:hypothetical protein
MAANLSIGGQAFRKQKNQAEEPDSQLSREKEPDRHLSRQQKNQTGTFPKEASGGNQTGTFRTVETRRHLSIGNDSLTISTVAWILPASRSQSRASVRGPRSRGPH